jgi:hypothetical protein
MTNSLDAVNLYVPLMKETNMTWEEIKKTPRYELEGILAACHEYSLLHSMDGYEAKDINDMAKHRPSIRGEWNRYMEQRRKYERLAGQKKDPMDVASELKSQLS